MNNANSTQKSTVIGMTLGFIGVLAFSLTLPMTQIALRELSPEQIAIWRAIYAALAAGVVLLVFRPERPRGIQFLPLIGCSLGTAFGFPIFISLAMQTVSASQGAIVVGLLPMATAIFGVLIGKEKVGKLFWLFSLAGTLLTLIFVFRNGGAQLKIGHIYLFLAVVSAGFGYASGGVLSRQLKAWSVACWSLIIALPILLIVGLSLAPLPTSSSWQVMSAFAYLALVSQLFGFFAWYRGMALAGIARVSQLQLLQLFLTIGFAAVFLGDTLGLDVLIFGAAVSVTVWLSSRQKQARS